MARPRLPRGFAMRIDALLTRLGIGSRSEVQKLIRRGAVSVNGMTVRTPGESVHPGTALTVNGQPVDARTERTVMLYKPVGVLTAARDPKAPTVMDLLPVVYRSLGCMPVGRLDKDTTGLLLLTTDGELAHRLISPRRDIEKTYLATVDTPLRPEDITAFAAGLDLGDFTAKAAVLEIADAHTARITVTEGKYHQVRRMLAACGHETLTLHRERVGPLTLDPALQPGEMRELADEELTALKTAVEILA